MVALSGITCARDGEENEREVWNEEAGSRLFNLSRMHALLTSSMFLEPVPLDAKALLSTRAYKATLQAIRANAAQTDQPCLVQSAFNLCNQPRHPSQRSSGLGPAQPTSAAQTL